MLRLSAFCIAFAVTWARSLTGFCIPWLHRALEWTFPGFCCDMGSPSSYWVLHPMVGSGIGMNVSRVLLWHGLSELLLGFASHGWIGHWNERFQGFAVTWALRALIGFCIPWLDRALEWTFPGFCCDMGSPSSYWVLHPMVGSGIGMNVSRVLLWHGLSELLLGFASHGWIGHWNERFQGFAVTWALRALIGFCIPWLDRALEWTSRRFCCDTGSS